jgi:hypothetical protein
MTNRTIVYANIGVIKLNASKFTIYFCDKTWLTVWAKKGVKFTDLSDSELLQRALEERGSTCYH